MNGNIFFTIFLFIRFSPLERLDLCKKVLWKMIANNKTEKILTIILYQANLSVCKNKQRMKSLEAYSFYLSSIGFKKQCFLQESTGAFTKQEQNFLTYKHFLYSGRISDLVKILLQTNFQQFLFIDIRSSLKLGNYEDIIHLKNENFLPFLSYSCKADFKGKKYLLDANQNMEPVVDNSYDTFDYYQLTGDFFFTKEVLQQLSSYRFFEEFLHERLTYEKQRAHLLFYNKTISLNSDPKHISSWVKSIRPSLFLDRDGILIEDTGYPHDPKKLIFLDDVLPILHFAKNKNWHLIIITNQSGLARGLFKKDALNHCMDEIQSWMVENDLSFDRFYYCPYHQNGKIDEYRKKTLLRKPDPGMFFQAVQDFPIDWNKSFMIGDKLSDQINNLNLTCLLKGQNFVPSKIKERTKVFSSFQKILHYLKTC